MKKQFNVLAFVVFVAMILGIGGSASAQFLHQKKYPKPVYTQYSWIGTLDSTMPVTVWLERNDDNLLAGEIVYTASQTKSPIKLLGRVIIDTINGTEEFRVSEYLGRHSEKTGTMSFMLDSAGKGNGYWRNIDTTHILALGEITAFPQGKGGMLDPVNYTNIGIKPLYYSYYYYHPYKGRLGGEATIVMKEHRYIKFNVTITDPNIAEGDNYMDYNHANLKENKFLYIMRGCGYTFECHIFRDFIFLKSLTDRPTDCFGVGSSFDGFLVKRQDK